MVSVTLMSHACSHMGDPYRTGSGGRGGRDGTGQGWDGGGMGDRREGAGTRQGRVRDGE